MNGDPELAKMMRAMKVPAPVERIVRTDIWSSILSKEVFPFPKRVVELECGHKAITKNIKRVACKVCHDMILNGEDYDAFRNLRR